MKIIGFIYRDKSGSTAEDESSARVARDTLKTDTPDEPEMVLKGDSCLLVNRKPFFKPDWTQDIRASRCVVLRVSRLGKGIAAKFADRYYDAVAPGADFVAWDVLEKAIANGESWTRAMCFDYSLAVGSFTEKTSMAETNSEGSAINATAPNNEELVISPAEAIAQASQVMTIRQGDLIYIHRKETARPVVRDEVIEEEGLYCKIK